MLQPPRKKQRFASLQAPTVTSLVKARWPLETLPSPGSFMGSRIAVLDPGEGASACQVYVATSSKLYGIKVPLLGAACEVGKEGVFIPGRVEGTTLLPLPEFAHSSEIQSIALHQYPGVGNLIASTDCYGHCKVGRVPGPDAASSTSAPTTLYPASSGEGGWSGVALSPLQPWAVAVARHHMRDASLYDATTAQLARTFHLSHCPGSLLFPPATTAKGVQLLAVAEQHMVSLWDARMGESGGNVARLPVSPGGSPLYSLAWCQAHGGLLGAAGAERAVVLVDPRKWRQSHKWSGCSKYAVQHLAFSHIDSRYCYVAGLDYEVGCGVWDKSAAKGVKMLRGPTSKAAADSALTQMEGESGAPQCMAPGITFRGDERWLGMALAMPGVAAGGGGWDGGVGRDTLACLSGAGSVFVTRLEGGGAAEVGS